MKDAIKIKPIKFNECNGVLAKPEHMTTKECESLPVLRWERGYVSCWKVPFLYRLKLLCTGRIWLSLLTHSHPPVRLDVNKPIE